MEKKVALIVLDGFGFSKKEDGNAVKMAKMPFYNGLLEKYPNSLLRASGKFVGLKNGQMGNSETGHMNIGAGRIASQDLTIIDNAIFDGSFFNNKVLLDFFDNIKKHNGNAHFVGLLSNGGVHSHMEHLFALLKMAKRLGIKQSYVHIITDGRDVDTHSSIGFVKQLEKFIKESDYGKINSVGGRYYAMDRDKNYQYTKLAYNSIILNDAKKIDDVVDYLKQSHKQEITDEFITPAVMNNAVKFDNGKDGLMFYNFRKDRTKQLTQAFVGNDFKEFEVKEKIKNYVSMTSYGNFDSPVAFEKNVINNTLVEVLSKNGKNIAKFSEPTKFPHVTYFLNGGREEPFENEDWFKVPAKKVKTFDLMPEMSAIEIAQEVVNQTTKKHYDFVMVNLANCDMVGHTGDIKATIKAIETVDKSLKIMVENLAKKGYEILITADHGNAEQMIFRNKVCTTHTNNPVRLVYVYQDKKLLSNNENQAKDNKNQMFNGKNCTVENNKNKEQITNNQVSNNKFYMLKNGSLKDISSTILSLFDIEYPSEYTGKNLIKF